MRYSDFTIADLQDKFHLAFVEDQALFPHVPPYRLSQEMKTLLEEFVPLALAIDTGKARSQESVRFS